MKTRLGLKIGDLLLIIALGLLALGLFLLPLLRTQAETAEIVLAESGEVSVISLAQDASYAITSRDIDLTVCVQDGTVYVSESNCRDGICRTTAPISRGGQTIVCAPAGVVVRINGEEVAVDGISK